MLPQNPFSLPQQCFKGHISEPQGQQGVNMQLCLGQQDANKSDATMSGSFSTYKKATCPGVHFDLPINWDTQVQITS